MRSNLVERRDQIEEGKHPSLPQGIEDLVHARNRQLAEAADLVEFFVAHGITEGVTTQAQASPVAW